MQFAVVDDNSAGDAPLDTKANEDQRVSKVAYLESCFSALLQESSKVVRDWLVSVFFAERWVRLVRSQSLWYPLSLLLE